MAGADHFGEQGERSLTHCERRRTAVSGAENEEPHPERGQQRRGSPRDAPMAERRIANLVVSAPEVLFGS